jgi:hypothetical protein
MTQEFRPTPVLKGKVAERFYHEINSGDISQEQKNFLNDCLKFVEYTCDDGRIRREDTIVSNKDVPALQIQVGGNHYKTFQIQPVEYIVKNDIPYMEGNVIKYVSRHSAKGGIDDIRKAYHYLKLIAEMKYGQKLEE